MSNGVGRHRAYSGTDDIVTTASAPSPRQPSRLGTIKEVDEDKAYQTAPSSPALARVKPSLKKQKAKPIFVNGYDTALSKINDFEQMRIQQRNYETAMNESKGHHFIGADDSDDDEKTRLDTTDDVSDDEYEFESATTSSEENVPAPAAPLARTSTIVRFKRDVLGLGKSGEKLRRCASQPISVGRPICANAEMIPPLNLRTPRRATTFEGDSEPCLTEDGEESAGAQLEKSQMQLLTATTPRVSHSPRVGTSTIFPSNGSDIASVQLRSYIPVETSGWSLLRRSTGMFNTQKPIGGRSTEQHHTLVYYSPDCMGIEPRTLFRVPNSEIDPYMRTALMRAHKSTSTKDGPFRLCSCGIKQCTAHPLPDVAAKFVAVLILDTDVQFQQDDHRRLFREHLKREGALARGAWDIYRMPGCDLTDFISTPVTHVYLINRFA